MKTIQTFKPRSLHIIGIEKPFLTEENNVLVRTTAAGICSSNIGIYHGINVATTYPKIVGHEMADVVEEIVSFITSLRSGDRVIVNQVISCGHCYLYHMGRRNVCDSLAVRDVHIDGGYQEYIAVPQEDCYLLPDSISDTGAVMVESVTVTIQSCARAELKKDDMFLVYGCGTLGGSILKIARLFCGYTIVANVIDGKLGGAESAGAAHTINVLKEDLEEKIKEYTHGHGTTVSTNMVCGNDSPIRPLRTTGSAGRVIIMGFSTSPIEINQFPITSEELDMRGPRLQNKMLGRAVELINEGKPDLTGSVSHTFPLLKA